MPIYGNNTEPLSMWRLILVGIILILKDTNCRGKEYKRNQLTELCYEFVMEPLPGTEPETKPTPF